MRYFTTPSGSVATRDGMDEAWVAPDGWTEVDPARYEQRLAEVKASFDEILDEKRAVVAQQASDDYDEMIAAGVPERVSRRLSGTKGSE